VIFDNSTLLKTIFRLKRNFAQGTSPQKKIFSGIEIAPFKNNAAAAVCISADFEMSWAWRRNNEEAHVPRGMAERQNVPIILRLLEEYFVPITWATVGHLFLENCSRSASGLAHATMPRPTANDRWCGDWYMHDPCSDFRKAPLWYAPDLIQQILECKTPQEIGTHSFSHINFSARCSTPDLVRRELEACVDAMRPFGLQPRSLVFPFNVSEYSYLPLFAETGIRSVRHRDHTVRLSYPERTESGVYRIYESMNLRTSKRYDYATKAKMFIDKAMERRAAYSLWFHPSDSIEVFEREFRHILQYMDSERSKGRLWITTMSDLAGYCEAREQLHLSVERHQNELDLSFRNSLDTSIYGTPEVSLIIRGFSAPKSTQLAMNNGERRPIGVRVLKNDGEAQLLVNVPTAAKSLRLTF